MATPNPCINNTDCITLSINGDGELEADPIVDPDGCVVCTTDGLALEIDPAGGLECGPSGLRQSDTFPGISADACNAIESRGDGLWVGAQDMAIACVSQGAASAFVANGAGAWTTIQSGEVAIENPLDCNNALGVRYTGFGTVQVTGLTPGFGGTTAGRVEIVTRSRVKRATTLAGTAFIPADPFIDGDFRVLENNGSGPLEHAFGRDSATVPFCPTPLGVDAGPPLGPFERFGYERRARIVGRPGTSCTVECQTAFLTYWMVNLA